MSAAENHVDEDGDRPEVVVTEAMTIKQRCSLRVPTGGFFKSIINGECVTTYMRFDDLSSS